MTGLVAPAAPAVRRDAEAAPAAPAPRRRRGAAWGRWARAGGLLCGLPLAALAAADVAANPPRFTSDQIEAGRSQFQRTCAQCHGRNMVNSGTTVYDLRKFPVDQPERFQHSVTEGKGNMPSFKEALSAEQIGVLWAYVGSRGGKEP